MINFSRMTGHERQGCIVVSIGTGWHAGLIEALLATLMAIFQTRLALAATELEGEAAPLGHHGLGALAILLGIFALASAAVLVAVVFWDSHRLLVLGCLTLLFAALSAGAIWQMRRLSRASAGLLAATLAELEADREAMMPRSKA